MTDRGRELATRLARESLTRGDARGWFESLYAAAGGNETLVPWADLAPNPNLVEWLERQQVKWAGKKALVVGCGLGDDAEELARRGFEVAAFDIAPTAIEWARRRFPKSPVQYAIADLLAPPPEWREAFDFVFEAYTLQVLPTELHPAALECLAALVAPGGLVLVICRGRDEGDPGDGVRFPLTRGEFSVLDEFGLHEVQFEDYWDDEDPPVRRFRAEFVRWESA
jgi:SAM-dependent methyltransferase